MENMFSLTTTSFEEAYRICLEKYKSKRYLLRLLDDIIFSIPLKYPDYYKLPKEKDSLNFKSFSDIKKYFYNEIKNTKKIEQLANLCLDLCEPYLYYDPVSNLVMDYNNSYFSQNFINSTFKTPLFRQALIDFMILSYFYTLSLIKKKKNWSSLKFVFNTLNDINLEIIDVDEYEREIKQLDNKVKGFYNRVSYKKRNFSRSDAFFNQYLYSLFTYQSNKNKHRLQWKSVYDVPIMLGLLTSGKRQNPFLHISLQEDYQVNLKEFLLFFDLRKQFKTQNINAIYKKIIDADSDNVLDLTIPKLHLYQQFMMERITNINLINKCNEIVKTSRMIPSIFSLLASYPLVKFRLTLLDLYINKFHSCNPTEQENLPDLFEKILHHHIFCVFPLINMIFHMLMIPKNNIDNINQYFRSLQSRFNLFTLNVYNEIQPLFPFGSTSSPIIYKAIYKDFFFKLQYSTHFDILKTFRDCRDTIENKYNFLSSFNYKYSSYNRKPDFIHVDQS